MLVKCRFGCALLLGLAALASAGMPMRFGPPGRSAKPNPAVESLRQYSATVHTTMGDMQVRFYADEAPNAVQNFIKLALQGFYDGQRIYCIFPDRMVLAGDPTGTGTGDNGTQIPYERTYLSFIAGTLAMDRNPHAEPVKGPDGTPRQMNSGSRFFIVVADQQHLDRDYTAFGTLTDGLDVAKRIGAARTTANEGTPKPVEDILIERISVKKRTSEPSEPKPTGE
jgi:peptidyl-prolyl cis-trans isomerase B (cyclophilin B)